MIFFLGMLRLFLFNVANCVLNSREWDSLYNIQLLVFEEPNIKIYRCVKVDID